MKSLKFLSELNFKKLKFTGILSASQLAIRPGCIRCLAPDFYATKVITVVWEKLVVGNIHEKKFRGKKFSS